VDSLETVNYERDLLENAWKKYRTLRVFALVWLALLGSLLLSVGYLPLDPLSGLSIGWFRTVDLLLCAAFVTLGFSAFPSKGERETWAQFVVLEFRISKDLQKFADKLESLGSAGMGEILENPTFRYWVPLYREFQRLGIDVPAPVEERFAKLDRNRLDIFWAPVRRERQLKALKSVE
jgi:hypothetical protein